MRKPRSSVLRNVLSHFRLAQFSNEHPEIEVQTIVQFKNASEIDRRAFLREMGQYALLAGAVRRATHREGPRALHPTRRKRIARPPRTRR